MSNNLADRCEAASGADRKLDALIWCRINGKRYRGHNPAYGEAHLTQVEYTEPPKRTRLVTGSRGGLPHALPVTASIDAALTLVPTGYGHIEIYAPDGENSGWTVHIIYGSAMEASGYGATLELAFVAAALRAKENTGNAC